MEEYYLPQSQCKFSSETEVNSTLLFLDVLIECNNGFFTSIYHKPTFSGLFTNFDSFIPLSFKHGLVYTLLDRYFKKCSSYHIFHSEVVKLKNFPTNNGYPIPFFDFCLGKFLYEVFSVSAKNYNVSKRVIYFSMPFTGKHCVQIPSQLTKFLSYFPEVELWVIFKSNKHLSSFFRFKDSIPKLMRLHVYQYLCQCCGALYIGHTCISEHLGILPLTGKKRSYTSLSSILSHIKASHHTISANDFSIISSP